MATKCEKCADLFGVDGAPEWCPDCGRRLVKILNRAEQLEVYLTLPANWQRSVFTTELAGYDWFACMSDSHAVWVAGEAAGKMLGEMARRLPWSFVCEQWSELAPTAANTGRTDGVYNDEPPADWNDNGAVAKANKARVLGGGQR